LMDQLCGSRMLSFRNMLAIRFNRGDNHVISVFPRESIPKII
jgi:hypothetical protein